jgi:hypothetical protein
MRCSFCLQAAQQLADLVDAHDVIFLMLCLRPLKYNPILFSSCIAYLPAGSAAAG